MVDRLSRNLARQELEEKIKVGVLREGATRITEDTLLIVDERSD